MVTLKMNKDYKPKDRWNGITKEMCVQVTVIQKS